jgi:SRSO17 transposase
MKKSSAKRTKSIKEKRREYNYTTLEKCEVGADAVNFFAVILEATFPHKSPKSDKFVVSLKLADLSSKFD